jgi:hypothetical protein
MTKRNSDQNIQDWVNNGVYIYSIYYYYHFYLLLLLSFYSDQIYSDQRLGNVGFTQLPQSPSKWLLPSWAEGDKKPIEVHRILMIKPVLLGLHKDYVHGPNYIPSGYLT